MEGYRFDDQQTISPARFEARLDGTLEVVRAFEGPDLVGPILAVPPPAAQSCPRCGGPLGGCPCGYDGPVMPSHWKGDKLTSWFTLLLPPVRRDFVEEVLTTDAIDGVRGLAWLEDGSVLIEDDGPWVLATGGDSRIGRVLSYAYAEEMASV